MRPDSRTGAGARGLAQRFTPPAAARARHSQRLARRARPMLRPRRSAALPSTAATELGPPGGDATSAALPSAAATERGLSRCWPVSYVTRTFRVHLLDEGIHSILRKSPVGSDDIKRAKQCRRYDESIGGIAMDKGQACGLQHRLFFNR